MSDLVTFTTPLGRIVSGDVYKANDKDSSGRPLVVKSGPNMGQPKVNYYIGLAIPKNPGIQWEMEPWGQKMMQVAKMSNPGCFDPQTGQLYQDRSFAFKIDDGDSTQPNTKGIAPVTREGWPGHWILHFSNGFAPKCYNSDGTAPLQEQMIKRGFYVQVNATINGNTDQQNPGIFLNHNMIAFQGYGEEIIAGPDASSVGFGQQALPAGASATPIGGMNTNPSAMPQQNQPVTAGMTINQQDVNAMVNPQVQPQVNQQMNPQVQPQVNQQVNPQMNPQMNPQVQPQVNQQVNPQVNPQVQPATDLVNQQVNPQVQPQVNQQVQPGQAGAPPQQNQQGVEQYNVNGQILTREQLLNTPGWTEAHLANLPRV